MSAAKTVRRPQKIDAARPASPVVPVAVPKRPTRDELLTNLTPPLLTLDDIVIVGKHGKESERLVITGEELAHVLSLREQYNNIHHMADSGYVNLMLRGMAELLMGNEGAGNPSIGSDGAFFLSHVLDDLAAKLEADSPRVDAFSVFLRKKSAATKAVA